jgi:hypothetical protein
MGDDGKQFSQRRNKFCVFLAQPDMAPDDGCLEHLFIGFIP